MSHGRIQLVPTAAEPQVSERGGVYLLCFLQQTMDRGGLEPRADRSGQGSNEVHRFIALPLENEGMPPAGFEPALRP